MVDHLQIGDGHPPANRKKKINLTEEERKRIIAQLMIGCIWVDDLPKLDKKAISRVAKDFDKHVCTVRRLWDRAKQNFSQFGKLTSTPRKSTGRPARSGKSFGGGTNTEKGKYSESVGRIGNFFYDHV
jgi:hypothetical protein